MKHRITVLVTALGLSLCAQAQERSTSTEDAAADLSVRGMQTTIDTADAQFEMRQSEVLAAAEPDEDALDEALGANAAPEDTATPLGEPAPLTSAEDLVPPADFEPQEEASTEESDLDLPTSVETDDAIVDDVYLDFGDEAAQSVVTREADTISVDFPDEDVRTIIRNVADLYELNVVIPEALVGSVSLKLRDVSWRQVFDVVLEPLNHTWVEDGNIIKIKSLDELLAEPVSTRVFVIDFATAGEIAESVGPMVDGGAGGRLQVDTRSNALVITERPSRMGDIQAIIQRLDRPTDQVMIESKFVEVTRRDQHDLGINWAALGGYEVSAGPFDRAYERENSSATQSSRETQSGSTFDLQNGIELVDSDISQNISQAVSGTSRLDTAVFNADAFSVILSALENNNEVQLVSNPTVVTMNNTVAQINIGEEFPIPEYRYNEERGTFEVSGFEYKPIGILLNVTPQVNSAGFVNLAIKPEISSRTGEVNFGGAGGASIPIVTTRRTESTVTIKSGYTLAIGGLMEQQTGALESKVPVLGDIPGLGRLFRSETDTLDARNLIIFITAKVLNPDGSTYEDVFDRRTLDEMGISPRDVPGYTPPASEEQLYERLSNERAALENMRQETELKQQIQLLEQLRDKAQEVEIKRLEKQERKAIRGQ
ncbi:MAG: secretin N-terminal domain-containing protein [Opitutales bacterium]